MTTSKSSKVKPVDDFSAAVDADPAPASDPTPEETPASDAPASDPSPDEAPPASAPASDPPPPAPDTPPASADPEEPDEASDEPTTDTPPYGVSVDEVQLAAIDEPEDKRYPWNVSTMGPPPPNHETTYRIIDPPAAVPTVFTPEGKATEPEPHVEF